MRSKLREAILRNWTSALLQSNLTVSDLNEVAEEITSDSDVLYRMSHILREVALAIGPPPQQFSAPVVHPDSVLDELNTIVENIGLNKRSLYNHMKKITNVPSSLVREHSTSEMLRLFVENESKDACNQLLKNLYLDFGDVSPDQFLKGISRKK